MVCTVPVDEDLAVTGRMLQHYAQAGFDDAVMLLRPGGPSPDQVRALYP